ncbi:MAG: hypothetical protein P8M72_05640 [Gammaproteobacteria bacterium]|nr:hypothetical protein [Gammaproteobacteria bacterium]
MNKILLALLTLLFNFSVVAQAPKPTGAGPYPAVFYSDSSLPNHTVFHPADLEATGNEKLPIVVWGNGGCADSNFSYREFLAEIASYGFLVVAISPNREMPPPPPDRSGTPEQWPPFATSTGDMIDGLNWAISVSDREGTELAGHVDTSHIAVMGHSCGGLQAIEASSDKRITTTLVLNSGLFDDGDPYMQRFSMDRSFLDTLYAPIGYFIGGETDIAYANAEKDWPLIKVPSVNMNLDVGHGATYQMPGGGPFTEAPLAWLKWQLKNDEEAVAMFRGEDCGFCNHIDWQLKKRHID